MAPIRVGFSVTNVEVIGDAPGGFYSPPRTGRKAEEREGERRRESRYRKAVRAREWLRGKIDDQIKGREFRPTKTHKTTKEKYRVGVFLA